MSFAIVIIAAAKEGCFGVGFEAKSRTMMVPVGQLILNIASPPSL